MKRFFSFALIIMVLALSLVSCNNAKKTVTLDASKAINFRCNGYLADSGKSFQLNESISANLFKQCFDGMEEAKKLDVSVNIGHSFIDLEFIGDSADTNALIVNGNACYGSFTIYSNDIVFFKYDTVKDFYQYEDGFYQFINTQVMIFKK